MKFHILKLFSFLKIILLSDIYIAPIQENQSEISHG